MGKFHSEPFFQDTLLSNLGGMATLVWFHKMDGRGFVIRVRPHFLPDYV